MEFEMFGIRLGSPEFSLEALAGALMMILLLIAAFRVGRKRASSPEPQSEDQYEKWKAEFKSKQISEKEVSEEEVAYRKSSEGETLEAESDELASAAESVEISFSVEGDAVEQAKGETELVRACMEDQSDLLERLINEGEDVNAEGEGGRTALLHASMSGAMDSAIILIHHGANIDVRDGLLVGNTPLIYAAQNSMYDLMDLLIEKGADVNDPNYDGHTPLLFAGISDDLDAFEKLLSMGADVNARDKDGRTPLIFLSAHPGKRAFSELLLDHGADINARDSEKRTALQMAACADGDVENMEMLLERGADISLADDGGYKPIDCAKEKGNQPVIELLQRYGAA